MKSFLETVTIVVVALTTSGCSLIGFAIGSNLDEEEPMEIDRDSVSSLAEGDEVRLTIHSGDTLAGVFRGARTLGVEEYRHFYEELATRISPPVPIPMPGDRIVVRSAGGTRTGRFEALQYGSLVLAEEETGDSWSIPCRTISSVSTPAGDSVTGMILANFAEHGQLPGRRVIVLRQSDEVTEISLERVVSVVRIEYGGARWGLLAIGASLDLTVLLLLSAGAGVMAAWR